MPQKHKRGLRPSEAMKLKKIGFSQEDIDNYIDSGFKTPDDYIDASKEGVTDPDLWTEFRRSKFQVFSEFKDFYDAGFDDIEEWKEAKRGGFPTRKDWIMATSAGFETFEEYFQSLPPDQQEQLRPKTIPPPEETTSAPQEPEVTYVKEELTSLAHEPSLPESNIQEPSLSEPEEIPQEPEGLRPIPKIKSSLFLDHPMLERMYRLAEILQEISYANWQISLDDFTSALSFEDVFDTEEFLADILEDYCEITGNTLIFQPDTYNYAIDQIEAILRQY